MKCAAMLRPDPTRDTPPNIGSNQPDNDIGSGLQGINDHLPKVLVITWPVLVLYDHRPSVVVVRGDVSFESADGDFSASRLKSHPKFLAQLIEIRQYPRC